MIGLPCSGKTTKALELEKEYNALRLTPDEWQLALFGDDALEEAHDERHSTVEAIMWRVAARTLALGVDVILDFGCWAKCERNDFKNKAFALGADFKLHYMEASIEELVKRLEKRNEKTGVEAGVFHITKEQLCGWAQLFEPPSADEL